MAGGEVMAAEVEAKSEKAWGVYVLLCAADTLYTGITCDLSGRYDQHRRGRGARYTRMYPPQAILAWRPCADRAAASRLEAAVKRMTRKEKWHWIEEHPYLCAISPAP